MTDQDLKTILCSKCDTLNSDHARWCRSCGAAFPDNPVRILPPGTMLDHEQYTITAFMGRGDASLTYRARKKNSAGEVVVKEYYPEGIAMRDQDGYRVRPASPDTELGYDQGLRQFMHAGNILHSFRIISNIAAVRDVFEANGTAYITEDYIDGLPLSAILQQKKIFSFDEALDCVRPVMQALIRVHESGVMHRNINPSNIMVSDGEASLIDFGIAGNIRNQTMFLKGRQNKQGAGVSCTRGYSAPEQMDDTAPEAAWTDVYGMAATLYRMVTGDEPEDAEARMAGDRMAPPADIVPGVNMAQSDVIMKGMALNAEARYQDMGAFLDALEACRENKKKPGPVPVQGAAGSGLEIWKERLGPVLPAVIIVLLCLLVGAAGLSVIKRLRPSGGASAEAGVEEGPAEQAPEQTAPDAGEPAAGQTASAEEKVPEAGIRHLRSDIGVSGDMRMGGDPDVNEYVFGNTACRREDIEAISFVNSLEGKPEDAWDVSAQGNGEVYAWEKNGHLFIGADGIISLPPDCTGLFCFYTNLKRIDFGRIDTSEVTDMTFMFKQDMLLTGLDLSGFDTSGVESMDRMFTQCRAIRSLDLSGFDTSKVTNMLGMFAHCMTLTELNVSSFDTSNVTNMGFLFYNCNSIQELDITSFDTSRVTHAKCMFLDCENLKILYFDTAKFRTGNVTDMHSMFNNCRSLVSLDVSHFDTGKVTDMAYMFYNDQSLTKLAFDKFDMSRVEKRENMLTGTIWE